MYIYMLFFKCYKICFLSFFFSDTRAGYTLHLTKIFSSIFLYSFRNISNKNFYAFHQILGISKNADI